MKSVLLYANQDAGLESRLQAALDLVRAFGGHLTCLQVTPFDAFVMGDPFGGVYALPAVMERVHETGEAHRTKIQERLAGEGVAWEWLHYDGGPAQLLVDRARLQDVIVLGLEDKAAGVPRGLTADVVVHTRTPVLAVPQGQRGFDPAGPALVAWNGAIEAANALRLTRSMLAGAAAVHVVTVAEERIEFPATDACRYLARHGIEAELHEWPGEGRSTAEALIDAARALDARVVVMGAYGHTRMREAVLGGATRDMLHDSPVPLLLAH